VTCANADLDGSIHAKMCPHNPLGEARKVDAALLQLSTFAYPATCFAPSTQWYTRVDSPISTEVLGWYMPLKNQIRDHCPKSVIDVMQAVRRAARSRASRQYLRNLINGSNPIKLELGAGNKTGSNGWTTLDLALGSDICCNLAKGLPFPDNSVSDIYSSHFFEHLTYGEARTLMDDCMRVLKPEGRFSICVPNARLYLEAYFGERELTRNGYITYEPAFNHTTKIDYVNYVAYMNGQHKYMFDEENLVHLLQARGFKKVRVRGFDENLDMESRALESIYAEAYK